MKRNILAIICFIFIGLNVSGQAVVMSNGTVNVCGGNFLDSGSGSGYTSDDFVMTLCPDVPGNVVQLTFSAFQLQVSPGQGQSDSFAVFDGPSTSSPSLGSYGGNDLQGFQITGTVNNTSGCITIAFSDNGPPNPQTAPNSAGWEASIACTIPCDPPTGASVITAPNVSNAGLSASACVGQPVSFADAGSFAAPGFEIASYVWNFDDGVIEQGPNMTTATHVYTEPGEYVASLTVIDDNGCGNLNLIPLQVLVSTIPLFPSMEDVTTCFGNEVELAGEAESTLWTALPPQITAGTTYLADGAGFSYESTVEFDIFQPDQVVETCDDFLGIVVNMEHSFMGDLGITITCPNGTTVPLVTYPSGGGGTFLGEAIDNDPANDPGIGYTYTWEPTATNGTWGENAPGNPILPAGAYEAVGNLCDMVGCPLNGTWTLAITDNLAADNGHVFWWGVNLDPSLFPGVTTFQPTIGIDADSSYWTGPHIIDSNLDADTIVVSPPFPGAFDYVYHVVNSFGCTFDTTITVTFEEVPAVSAGPDQIFNCNELTLLGGFAGQAVAQCSQDAGVFEYCYENDETFEWVFCPDNPGDGTVMTLTFLEGTVESFFDDLTFYDGATTAAPVIELVSNDDLVGQSWTATNPGGCLTVTFDADGSVSCGSGGETSWVYEVGCTTGGPDFTWSWTPTDDLSNPNSPTPTIAELTQTTTFTLTGYPVGNPNCAVTDQVTVTLDDAINPGIDSTYNYCINESSFNLFGKLGGNPNPSGDWTDPSGNAFSGVFNPSTGVAGEYTYTVTTPDCQATAIVTLEQITPITYTMADDTLVCANGDLNLYVTNVEGGLPPYNYRWTYNGALVSQEDTDEYNPTVSGPLCVNITDICNTPSLQCLDVTVETPIPTNFEADTTMACFPYIFDFTNLINASQFESIRWELGDGRVVEDLSGFSHSYGAPGNYTVSLSLTSELGCVYTETKNNYITVLTPPVAQFFFNPQPADIRNTEITFTDISVGQIQSYEWLFNTPDVLGGSLEQNPVFQFPADVGGEYPVRLTVVDGTNCEDSYEATVVISDIFQYYLPTAFTPNGDGINDIWRFEGADIDEKSFELIVFDRWGNKVFATTDPKQVWDGGVNGGDYFATNGIYNWIATIRSIATGERKEIQGTVLLMR